MFAQTFCDSSLDLSRRGWTTLLSFGLECLAVAALIAVPLFHVESLPQVKTIAAVFTPIVKAIPAEPIPVNPGHPVVLPYGEMASGAIRQPSRIPNSTADGGSLAPAPEVPWGVPHGANPLNQIVNDGPVSSEHPILAHRFTVSQGVMEGSLIQKIQPVYPHLALVTHTEGSVMLQAVISREGIIENLQVVSGSPYLSRAAVDAVRQWRYRPYRLNGEPVEVETQIVVNFTLGEN
ncbi:MAG TPA: TonB family protein [Terriglobales bacterium]|jgi:protein TonB